MNQESFFMNKALEQAQLALENQEVPVGAILARGDKIIGKGYNQCISTNDPSAHAEIIALRNAARSLKNYRLQGSIMYVTLEPCLMCAGALVNARVDEVIFSTRDPKAGVVVSNACLLEETFLNHKVRFSQGAFSEKSAKLLKIFFEDKRH